MYYPVGCNLASDMSTITRMTKVIKAKNYEKLGLVCTGSSGAIMAAIIAVHLDPIPSVLYIKKKFERNHGHSPYGLHQCKNLIFIDDFIASGATIKHVIKQLKLIKIKEIQGICLGSSSHIHAEYIRAFFKEQLEIPED